MEDTQSLNRATAVEAAIGRIRRIAGDGAIDRTRLAAILEEVKGLARRAEYWSEAEFPPAEAPELQARYRIRSDPDQRFSLYLNVLKPGKIVAPHNHTTWACIAAVEGEEHNTLYRRTDDGLVPGRGTLEERAVVVVAPGDGIALMPDDIHKVDIRGSRPIRHLHLYGLALESLSERVTFDLAAGTVRPMGIGVASRGVDAGTATTATVAADELYAMLRDGRELALFDVREAGQFGVSHLFHAVSLPFSRLEIEAPRLAPCRGVRMVLVDDDESVAHRAAARLAAIGYTGVRVLRGGNAGWVAAGHRLFAGIHVPSKAFGELVEQHCHTPDITATELAGRLARGEDVVVLDGRPYGEYQKMSIPGAVCCPNGELGLWAGDLVPDERTLIVVNCAGRTRSIIGAQTLRNLGLRNPVVALRNGTMGWLLDGLNLAHAGVRRHPVGAVPRHLGAARAAAQALARRHGVMAIDTAAYARWRGDATRTTVLLDVRTPEEQVAGSHADAWPAPGGQLLQYTDLYVGVRHARVVLLDTDGVRAPIVASWLRQMGIDACLLPAAPDAAGRPAAPSGPQAPGSPGTAALPGVTVDALAGLLRAGAVAVVDVRASMRYRTGHVPGAIWSIRPWIAARLAGDTRPIVLVADDPALAVLAAGELPAGQRERVSLLEGGMPAWERAGLPVVATPATPPDSDCIDFLFFVHDRHDGNFQAARDYLAWETGLVERLEGYEREVFRLLEDAG